MNMNNSGNPDNPTVVSETEANAAPARRFARWLVPVVGILAVGIAVLIASQVIGVFYAIIFPPHPPLPDNLTEISRNSEAYGVDEWIYSTNQNSCELIAYYQDLAGFCRISPSGCAGAITTSGSGDFVGRCSGEIFFSIFAMTWYVDISTGYQDGPPTHLKVKREVYWSGEIPRVPYDFNLPES